MSQVQQRLKMLSADQRALFDRLAAKQKETENRASLRPPQIVPKPQERYQPFPLTDIQQAQWFGRSGLFDITVAGHGYVEMDCDGMSLARLQTAFRRLIADNDQLRMVVLPNLRQQVLKEVPDYEFKVYDLRGKTPAEVDLALAQVRERMSHDIIPADTWPIFEVCASVMEGGRLRIHFNFDLLVGDAWCFRMLIDEWARVYDDLDGGRPQPQELSYRDYVLALKELEATELFERDLAYWKKQLEDLPPPPQLPMAQSPASLTQFRAQHWSVKLSKDTWGSLKKKLGRERLTPSGFFAAALSEVITLWNKEPRHALNVTVFNRLPLHPEIQNILVGEFNSFQLLAVENAVVASFAERARRLQALLWDHLEHRWISGVRLMRELAQLRGTGAGESLMPVVFTSTLAHHQSENNIPTRSPGKWVHEVSQTPQVWMEHHLWEEQGELLLHVDVVEGPFPEGMMQDFMGAYEKLITRLEADDGAWQELNGNYLLPDYQRRAWEEYNRTGDESLSSGYLHTKFEKQARARPQQTAIISARGNLTYCELDSKANQLAHCLRLKGAGPNQLIAIVASKGWEQVAAAVGIVKSGAAYLPLDADTPQDRLGRILEDGKVRIVVTTADVRDRFEWPQGIALIALDEADLSGLPVEPPQPVQKVEDIAYVIYTSGSTGKPKGVVIDHRGAVNTINDINRRFEVNATDRVFALSALSFDLSVYDIFGALSAGASVVMPDHQSPDLKRWMELASEHHITIWNSVPALMEMLVTYAEERGLRLPSSLRCCLLSGDWIPLSLPGRLEVSNPEMQVISLGGATEASVWSIYYPVGTVEPEWSSIPYGMPLGNQKIYVLNSSLEPCPYWVQGDLYIGGAGVAKGYWGDEEKTRASFIVHPRTGERLYRTGDLGRLVPAGYVEFMGRNDNQVKIRGYRIELGEIENALNKLDGVQACVVGVRGDTSESRQLVAYVVPEAGSQLDSEHLMERLHARLPNYMVPGIFAFMENLPLTSNGKIDRKNLPSLDQDGAASRQAHVAPRNVTEEKIAELWRELLDVDQVGVYDNFFNLGGNSLNASLLLHRIHDVFEVELPLAKLFEATTVAKVAELVEELIRQQLEAISDEEAEGLVA